jgi:hypothetical protein
MIIKGIIHQIRVDLSITTHHPHDIRMGNTRHQTIDIVDTNTTLTFDIIEVTHRVIDITPLKPLPTKLLNRIMALKINQEEPKDTQILPAEEINPRINREVEIDTPIPQAGVDGTRDPPKEAAVIPALQEEVAETQILRVEAVVDFLIDHQADKDLAIIDAIHHKITDNVHRAVLRVAHQEEVTQTLIEEIRITTPQEATRDEDIVNNIVVADHQEEKLRAKNQNSNLLYLKEILRNILGGDVDSVKR